jgi:hypothetical protein
MDPRHAPAWTNRLLRLVSPNHGARTNAAQAMADLASTRVEAERRRAASYVVMPTPKVLPRGAR